MGWEKKVTFGILFAISLASLLFILNLPTSNAFICQEDTDCDQEAGQVCSNGQCVPAGYPPINVSINGKVQGQGSFVGGPISISLGQKIDLMWNWSSGDELNFYPQKCTASGDWSGVKACEGFGTVVPSTQGLKTYNFTWQDWGRLGTVFDPTTIYYDWFQVDVQIICGDGFVQPGEVCDDGVNNGQPNQCNSQCTGITASVCGNSVIEDGEQCDDGNTFSGDGCDNFCQFECELTSASWSTLYANESEQVYLNVQGNNCDGDEIAFEVLEDDPSVIGNDGDDPVTTEPVNVFFSGNAAQGSWIAEYQIDGTNGINDPPEYHFIVTALSTGTQMDSGTASNELLTVNQSVTEPCQTETVCGDYLNQGACSLDSCSVAANSVGSIDCNDPDITCYCAWNTGTSVCQGAYDVASGNTSIGPSGGTCFVETDSSDTCDDDGFLTLTWITNWQWDPDCQADPDCLNDPENVAGMNQCIAENGQQDTIACPARIPLPFFNIYNIIAAILIISVIYWVINEKGKRKK